MCVLEQTGFFKRINNKFETTIIVSYEYMTTACCISLVFCLEKGRVLF